MIPNGSNMTNGPKTALELALEAARGGVIGQALETLRSPGVAATLEAMRSPAMSNASPMGLLKPVVANAPRSVPVEENFSIVLVLL